MKIAHVVTAVILALAFATPLKADPADDALAAFNRSRHARGDHDTALKLARPLAEQGNAKAQFVLGCMYGSGRGVPLDYVRAYMWLDLSARRGYGEATSGRDLFAKLLTPQQLDEARKLAREWQPAAR